MYKCSAGQKSGCFESLLFDRLKEENGNVFTANQLSKSGIEFPSLSMKKDLFCFYGIKSKVCETRLRVKAN